MPLVLYLFRYEGGGGVMPSISRPKTDIGSLSLFDGFSWKRNSPSNEHHRMKDFSLINHIESLKATAYGEFVASGDISKNNHDASYSKPISLQCSVDKSSSSKWALDPGSVEGNLRLNSNSRQLCCTLEDVVSRGSSCAKLSDILEGDDLGNNTNVARKKSAKGLKKRCTKRNEGRNSSHLEKSIKHSNSVSVFSELRKKCDSSTGFPPCELTVLSALCKSIKIHKKNPNSISVKDNPYQKKPSSVVTNIHSKSFSPTRPTLSNGMIDYNKKHSGISDQRKKQSISNSSVDEITKTKIFLSEKQSGVISDCGTNFPCAPPATPTTDQLKRIEYVPSLQDVRSQRSIRQRLQIIESKALKKEKKKKEDLERIEKMTLRERRIEKKKKQRQEIYALNKLMTEWEHERFKQFMSQAGSNF